MRSSWLAIALTGMVALCVQSWLRRLVRALGIAIASVALLSLTTSCAVHRTATESSRFKVQEFKVGETRDSLREEISQNLNENLTEHEVVTWTVTGFLRPAGSKRAELERPLTAYGLQGDTLRVERVTDRTRESGSKLTSGRVCSRSEESKQASLSSRSTADFHVDFPRRAVELNLQGSKVVEEVPPTVSGKLSAVSKVLKWIFWIIIGLIGLLITVKVCTLRR